LKDIPSVPGAEEYLQVNKYAQLGKQEKDSIVIKLTEIALIHELCKGNISELAEDDEDPLKKIIHDLGDVPSVPTNDGKFISHFNPTPFNFSKKTGIIFPRRYANGFCRNGSRVRVGEQVSPQTQ
jgi:hypothetical protein